MESKLEGRKSEYEGLQEEIRTMKLPGIETFENKYSDKNYLVEHEFPEFTCICPKTGLPDFATIRIRYSPDKRCIELKSFKHYLVAYRNVGIFHEHAINRILEDFVKAVKPRKAVVEGEFNIRGGMATSVRVEYTKSLKPSRGKVR